MKAMALPQSEQGAGGGRGRSSWGSECSSGGMECVWRVSGEMWFAFWKITLVDVGEWSIGARMGQRDQPRGPGAQSGDHPAGYSGKDTELELWYSALDSDPGHVAH